MRLNEIEFNTPLDRKVADKKADHIAKNDPNSVRTFPGQEKWSPEFAALVDKKRKERRAKEKEESERDYEHEANTWSAVIQRDCASFLSQVEDPFSLYKGAGAGYRFEKKQVRLDNRRPVEMDSVYHDAVNKYMTYKFGAPFRNALFVFGSAGEAEFFGNVHSIFPIGEFEFLWSPLVNDLNYKVNSMIVHNNPVPDWDGWIADHDAQALVRGVAGGLYQNTDLQEGIDSGNEIMVRCKDYYIMAFAGPQKTGQLQLMRDILE